MRILKWTSAAVVLLVVLAITTLIVVRLYPSLIGYQHVGIYVEPRRCVSPPPHVIRTEQEAIFAAHDIYACLNDWPEKEYRRNLWLKGFVAYKSKGLSSTIASSNAYGGAHVWWVRLLVRFPDVRDEEIWHVLQKPLPPGWVGGGVFMDISARDGRLVDYLLTQ